MSRRSARASGCCLAACTAVWRADHQPGLRAAEQLVAGEADERGAGLDRAADGRLVGEELQVLGEVAGADVVDHRHAELAQLLDLDLLDEAELAEVRGVRAQDRAGAVAERAARSRRGACGWWCRPHLSVAPGLGDDVGDAEAAADLDELAARDDDLVAGAGERRGGEQDGGGAVVDRERGLGAGELGAGAPRRGRGASRGCRCRRSTRASSSPGRRGSTASRAAAASGARPRFVWTITPVALRTRRSEGRSARATRSRARAMRSGSSSAPLRSSSRRSSIVARAARTAERVRGLELVGELVDRREGPKTGHRGKATPADRCGFVPAL